jgi:hypothetical protein
VLPLGAVGWRAAVIQALRRRRRRAALDPVVEGRRSRRASTDRDHERVRRAAADGTRLGRPVRRGRSPSPPAPSARRRQSLPCRRDPPRMPSDVSAEHQPPVFRPPSGSMRGSRSLCIRLTSRVSVKRICLQSGARTEVDMAIDTEPGDLGRLDRDPEGRVQAHRPRQRPAGPARDRAGPSGAAKLRHLPPGPDITFATADWLGAPEEECHGAPAAVGIRQP